MISWLIYYVRVFAAVMISGMAAVFLLIPVDEGERRWPLYLVSAVFGVAGFFAWPRRPNAWRRDPPTERQLAYARDLGITIPRNASKGELSDLISAAKGE